MNVKCPECAVGSLDLATPGDGRWDVSWQAVQCAVGGSTFVYTFEGSNPFYVKMRISNTRVPVASVNMQLSDNTFAPMARTQDGAWTLSSPDLVFPAGVQVTSVLGDTVLDSVATSTDSITALITGSAQFPLNVAVPSVPEGSINTESAPGGTAEAKAPSPTEALTPNTAPSAAEAPAGCAIISTYSQCGGLSGGTADAPFVGSCCATGSTCLRQNAYYWQCLPPSSQRSAPQPAVSFQILDPYSLCGGVDQVTSTASDAPYNNTACLEGFTCTRHSPVAWTCDPSTFRCAA